MFRSYQDISFHKNQNIPTLRFFPLHQILLRQVFASVKFLKT